MARVKKYLDTRASDSHERWLVSYADFITLLFAFFVVMYAISSVNEAKYRVVGTAIGTAFGISAAGKAVPGPQAQGGQLAPLPRGGTARAEAARRRRMERMQRTEQALAEALAPLMAKHEASVRQTGRGVVLDIGVGALFAPGEAALQPIVLGPLVAAVSVLKGVELQVEVEGHTDDKPLQPGARFPSNWELSSARASSVVRHLQAHGVAPERLAAVGYAEFRPVASNRFPEGRARNRRISIAVLDPEPPQAAPSPPDATAPLSYPPMEFEVQAR